MKSKSNYIELSSVIASVKIKESEQVIQISDAGSTFYLTINDWKNLKKYVDKYINSESRNETKD